MKECPNCLASNPSSARICSECGAELGASVSTSSWSVAGSVAAPTGGGFAGAAVSAIDLSGLGRSFGAAGAGPVSGRQADILFVLDCTASMQGEIDTVKDAITGFADTIQSQGVRVRVGLLEFRDRLNGEDQRVLTFDGSPFTADPAAFRRAVGELRATGGGDDPESSLDALLLAVQQPFADGSNRVLVLITDAAPHIPDKTARTVEQVAQAIVDTGIHQLYLVIPVTEPECQVYLKLLDTGTRGLAFDLGQGGDFSGRAEHFKRTLMNLGKTISQATR